MTEPALDISGGRPAVRLERYLPDPPAVVWQAITERAQLKRWFPCDVIVAGGAWVVGAAITFPFPPEVIDMTLTGTVLVVDEPRLLSYTWGEDEVLRFELHADGEGTRLVLTDELQAGWAARNAAGWEDCLDRLAGLPADPGAWARRFAAAAAATLAGALVALAFVPSRPAREEDPALAGTGAADPLGSMTAATAAPATAGASLGNG